MNCGLCNGCFYLAKGEKTACKRYHIKLQRDNNDVKKIEGCDGPFKKPRDMDVTNG